MLKFRGLKSFFAISLLACMPAFAIPEKLSHKVLAQDSIELSYNNDKVSKELELVRNSDLEFAFVPDVVANAIFKLTQQLSEETYSKNYQQVYDSLQQDTRTIEYNIMIAAIDEALAILTKYAHSSFNNPEFIALNKELAKYKIDLAQKDALIFVGPEEITKRSKKCQVFCKLLIRNCLTASNICAGNVTITGTFTLNGVVIDPANIGLTGPTGSTGPGFTGPTGATGFTGPTGL